MTHQLAEPQSTANKLERYYFLDGLRGWASLAVVFWHVFIQSYPINTQLTEFLRYLPVANGDVAVQLFFVISGFSLSIGYINRHSLKFLARIAASRYLRLSIPIFVACTLVHFAMVSGIIYPFEMRPIPYSNFLRFESTTFHLFKFSLFDVFFRFSYDQAYIIPLWTMSIELMGSIMTIAVLATFGRHRLTFLAFSTSLFFGMLFLNPFYSLFVAGMIISYLYATNLFGKLRYRSMLWIGFVLGWIGPLVTNHETRSPFYVLSVIILFGTTIWLTPIRQFFENRTSQFFGNISFPLYLMHGPVLWTFSMWLNTVLIPYKLSIECNNLLIGFSTIFVSIGAALIFSPINNFAIFASRVFGVWVVHSIESVNYFLKTIFCSTSNSRNDS